MSILKQAYQPEQFQEKGHELIQLLSQYLSSALTASSKKMIPWNTPKKELSFWKDHLQNGTSDTLFKTIIEHSIQLHNPNYMGHQICPPLPITALSNTLSALLNNGMAVYEMGIASSSIERIIIEHLAEHIGYKEQAGGFLTSGGTLANLTAMLSARKAKASEDVWRAGSGNKLAIMVSEEAHYCIDRAARIMGLGDDGIIKIPVTESYQINSDLLENYYQASIAKGIEVIALVGSAPSTSTGIYDDLEALANFSKKHNLWFHVDGAHGGAAIYSEKYKHILKGIEQADSVVIDGHKMLMTPSLTTALIYQNGQEAHQTFNQKAHYLLETSKDEDWYNIAKRTFECTKSMMSIHWYVILKTYGKQIFDEFVTTLYDLGNSFAELIDKTLDFEYALQPQSNIVCFRYKKSDWTEKETNTINAQIRQRIVEKGEFYIVQTKLMDSFYLRVTLMNPFTSEVHLTGLLDHIREIASEL
ncbi:MAG: aminotransferase class V-fold PLP-dependent enzyme [Flavobacteriaceae bacterium]|nr:aminotransferase class V-fold PLP-dependent enzyme [Flavobacteriaceae bacterium]